MDSVIEIKNKSNIKKNYFFNLIYQIFLIIVPLITTPYVSRILLPEGIGKYSYTYSIINYFILLATLGFATYGQREMAKFSEKTEKQSIMFWEIILVRFVSTFISFLLCIILCLNNCFKEYNNLMWFWSFLIVAQIFDITFLFQGNEEFGIIVIRNIIVKFVSIIMIFIFVNQKDDIFIYVICSVLSILFGNLSLWVKLPKKVVKVSIKKLRPWIHILPTLRLFIPTIAISVYTLLDKTLIGLMINDTYIEYETQIIDGVLCKVETIKKISDLENGYYEQSEKIVKLAMTIVTSLTTVMISRNTKEIANGNHLQVKNNIYLAFKFLGVLGFPIMFGLMAIAPNMIPWFLGDGYEKSIVLLQLFSPLVIIIGTTSILGSHYLLPYKKDTKYTIGVIIGALLNVSLNIFLIKIYWSIGAVIASLIAEFGVAFTMYLFSKKDISLKKILIDNYKYCISGIFMFLCVYISQIYLSSSILNTCILILEGIITYFIFLLILRDKFLYTFLKKTLSKIKKRDV